MLFIEPPLLIEFLFEEVDRSLLDELDMALLVVAEGPLKDDLLDINVLQLEDLFRRESEEGDLNFSEEC